MYFLRKAGEFAHSSISCVVKRLRERVFFLFFLFLNVKVYIYLQSNLGKYQGK